MSRNISLSEFITFWLETFKKNEVKPSSYSRLQLSSGLLSRSEIAGVLLADLTPLDVQRYVNELAAQKYSFSTIKKQLELIKASMRKAVSMKLIRDNPASEIGLPNKKLVKKPRNVQAYNEIEQGKLLAEIGRHTDDDAYLCIAFMIETGLRAGEALALRWSDVNIVSHRCRIHATIANPHNPALSYVQDSPKTDASIRTVPLTPKATEILNRLNARKQCEFVFERAGRRLEYQELIRAVKRLCEATGVPYRGAHVFRHTFATNCYYKGIDVKILSRLLGHSDVKVTYNTYINLYGDGFDDLYTALCM